MKPENRFIAKVHKTLPRYIYAEKTANPYRGGTPDCVYEGLKGYHWIEYKWLPRTPVRSFTPGISPLQRKWLMRAYENNREPWVVVGCSDGCFILRNPSEWEGKIPVHTESLFSIKELAELIKEKVS